MRSRAASEEGPQLGAPGGERRAARHLPHLPAQTQRRALVHAVVEARRRLPLRRAERIGARDVGRERRAADEGAARAQLDAPAREDRDAEIGPELERARELVAAL